jgi:UDP-N-acetylglucosamine 4,6-dehydratase
MKSVLITGGTGSFGQAFTERLLRDGLATRICVYSRGEHDQAFMARRFHNDSRLRFFIGDVRDFGRLGRAMAGNDTVVHAAALKRIEVGFYNPDEMVKTNVNGAMNVVEAAQECGVEKVIFLSTDKAFLPVSPYGHSKALAEQIFLSSNNTGGKAGPRFSVTRYGNVWGSAGSVVPTWRQMLEDGETILPISDPEVTRFYMTMDEAVDLVLRAIDEMPDKPLIPRLPAYRLGDVARALGAETVITGLNRYEKLHESMDEYNCSQFASRLSVEELRAAL